MVINIICRIFHSRSREIELVVNLLNYFEVLNSYTFVIVVHEIRLP